VWFETRNAKTAENAAIPEYSFAETHAGRASSHDRQVRVVERSYLHSDFRDLGKNTGDKIAGATRSPAILPYEPNLE
jgi:hypothetical protein